MQRASGGGRRTPRRSAQPPATMTLSQPCRSARGARRRQRVRHGSAPHRCSLLGALLAGCASALDATPRRAVIARLTASVVVTSTAPALAGPPDDAFDRPAPPRGFTASVSDAAVSAARKQKEKQRESALKELAVQERFQDDRMRRCREEVSDAWQDCFFLGTTPSNRGQQRRGPATW